MTDATATNQQTITLTAVYQGWDTFQRDLVKVIAPLSREQLGLPVAPTHWPIGMLVQHIINDRLWWFHLWLETQKIQAAPASTAQ